MKKLRIFLECFFAFVVFLVVPLLLKNNVHRNGAKVYFSVLFLCFVFWRFWRPFVIRRIYGAYGVVTVGKRGKGKDVLHAMLSHNRAHYSNIEYNKHTQIKPLTDLEINITPEQFLKGEYSPDISRKKLKDGIPFYISDGGIYLPSWQDNQLKKLYPSMPVTYAIYRHLYNASLHINTQVFNRLWLLLREQAECVVQALGTRKIGIGKYGWLFCKVRYYENYQDCENNLKPLKNRTALPFVSSSGDMQAVENSRRGKIKDYSYLIPLRRLKYDSRIFHKYVFGVKADSN